MFKNKLFLYGVGTGLIVGALLLKLMSYAPDAELEEAEEAAPSGEVAEPGAWDESDLRDAAEKLGFQVFPDSQKVYTEQQYAEGTVQAAAQAKAEAEAAHSGSTPSEPAPGGTVIMISSKMTSNDVGQLLYEAGLIPSLLDFKDWMKESGLESSIQVGVYKFTGQPSLEEIAAAITKP